jgi:hypothetical protein
MMLRVKVAGVSRSPCRTSWLLTVKIRTPGVSPAWKAGELRVTDVTVVLYAL